MKLKNLLLFAFACLLSTTGWSQARVVFDSNPYIVINDGAYFVIGNSNANAITNPNAGNIVSEDEFDYVKWNIGTATGTYVIPFITGNGVKIPLTVNKTTAGSGGTTPGFLFSTYGGLGTPNWDSFINRPTPVLHTVDIETGLVDNSTYVIDRYWIIDAGSYGSKPSATLDIAYSEVEHTIANNTIVEMQLGGQRYNSDANVWGDYLPQGSVNIATNVVSGIPAPAADLYRAWTLSSRDMPLPVELLGFDAVCDQGTSKIKWSTASEANCDYYLVERSTDGVSWEILKQIPGSGHSSSLQEYSIDDYAPIGNTTYYRLSQFDYNGDYKVFPPVASTCGDFVLEITSVSNTFNSSQMQMNVRSSINSDFNLYVMDMSGKVLIAQQGVNIHDGMNRIDINKNEMSMGIYIIQLVNENHALTKRVAIN